MKNKGVELTIQNSEMHRDEFDLLRNESFIESNQEFGFVFLQES